MHYKNKKTWERTVRSPQEKKRVARVSKPAIFYKRFQNNSFEATELSAILLLSYCCENKDIDPYVHLN